MRGVAEPDHPDRQEARDVREIRRPLVQDPAQQVIARVRRHAELEDEQRDRDREDAVAERLEATEWELVVRGGHAAGG